MKHSFLFVLILFFVISCGSKPNGEALILNYLQENIDGSEYEIIEVSEPDSLYSPFELINSLMISKSSRFAELSKQLANASERSSLKERKAAASEVAELAYTEYNDFEDSFDIIHALTDKYFNNRPANRVGFRAKYKVDGDLEEDVFYLERDLSAVGHTASELMDRYKELVDLNSKFFSLKTDAEEYASLMR